MQPFFIPPRPLDAPCSDRAWSRAALAVALMAAGGISLALELRWQLGRRLGLRPQAGTLLRLVGGALPATGWVQAERLPYIGRSHLSVLQLTGTGRALAAQMGWEVVESDWERVRRFHAGEAQRKHAAAVLAFASHARLRGYQASVIPGADGGFGGSADVEIRRRTEAGPETCLVEVEMRARGKAAKWRQYAWCGVSLCALTPASRAALGREVRALGIAGRATDLQTLARQAQAGEPGGLWLERWG